jgi:hypothetical protein
MGRANLSSKVMAAEMGISESQLSDQLNGRMNCHLSLWRMFSLPPEFWQEMVDLICEFHNLPPRGLTAQDEEYRRIGKAFCDVHAMAQRSVGR